MTEQLYVVKGQTRNHKPHLLAVFSKEGLAQTHAAKLRLGQEPNHLYLVEPLRVDEEINQEMAYWGYGEVNLQDPILDEHRLKVMPHGLCEALPEDAVEQAGPQDYGRPDLTFYAYAWDPETALAKVAQLMREHLDALGIVWTFIPRQGADR